MDNTQIHYRLDSVADRTREIFGSESNVKVFRIRWEQVAEDRKTGEPIYSYVSDDLGIGGEYLAMIMVAVPKTNDGRTAATSLIFNLDLLDAYSPREVAEMMAPELEHGLDRNLREANATFN